MVLYVCGGGGSSSSSQQAAGSRQQAASKQGGHMWAQFPYLGCDPPNSHQTWWVGTPAFDSHLGVLFESEPPVKPCRWLLLKLARGPENRAK